MEESFAKSGDALTLDSTVKCAVLLSGSTVDLAVLLSSSTADFAVLWQGRPLGILPSHIATQFLKRCKPNTRPGVLISTQSRPDLESFQYLVSLKFR